MRGNIHKHDEKDEVMSAMRNKTRRVLPHIFSLKFYRYFCYSKASIEIHLKVGTKGMIPLFLSANCTPKLCPDDNNCVNLRTDV
jgi:hypothetical protein